MWDYYGGHMFGWGFGGWLITIIFWGAIIALIVWAVRGFGGHRISDRDALDILKERYAKGEISKKEFEAKKKDLGG